MPSFDEHYKKCLEETGEEKVCASVNREIDAFAHYPNKVHLEIHRRYLHHKEGVEYFKIKYGEIGKRIAELHILQDCGHIPNAEDYYNGKCDNYGVDKL